MLIILIVHLILSAPCIERYCQTRAYSLDGNGSSYLLYCTFWEFLLVHDPLHKVNPASHIVQWSGHLHSVQLSTPQDAGKRIYEHNWYLLMFYRIALGVFDWAVPNVNILSYARFFIRLVLCTNGSESSERTNVRALRVAKTAQITWHTKVGQRSSRFDFSGHRGSTFVLSVRFNMYHNLTSIFL